MHHKRIEGNGLEENEKVMLEDHRLGSELDGKNRFGGVPRRDNVGDAAGKSGANE